MPEEQARCNCNNEGFLGNLFGGNSEILFFIIVFLLLFTDFGCCFRR